MNKRRLSIHYKLCGAAIFPVSVLGIGLSVPVLAQSPIAVEEVIVSARRQEESAQDVPIAISVYSQEQLDQRNISSGADLATYTPSLSVNQRFGPDQATFAIRGFTQELRTTASVGFYFAEVVAPRGGGSVTSGDGAGPGAFFDLQNVMVLKGPQGTLFGRNTTGGAIMLTPQEPTNQLEGYIEGSAGDYDMQRLQGVLNVPLSESARARFGVDTQQRDGHLKNVSGVGPSDMGNIDYIAGRASLMLDISDSLTNYTIMTYSKSETNGTISGMFVCNPGVALNRFGFCDAQLEHQGDDFYTIESPTEGAFTELEQWQAINTTAWAVNDDITIKNIISYADLEQTTRTGVFGTNFPITSSNPAINGLHFSFTESGQVPGVPTNSQTSFVEEIQVQGYAMDSSLTWQMGLYYENNKPDGESGSQSRNQIYCAESPGLDPASFECQDVLGQFVADTFGLPSALVVGNVTRQLGQVEYTSKAVYGEATYDITDDFKTTLGLRYTEDKAEGRAEQIIYRGFNGNVPGAPTSTGCIVANASPSCVEYVDQDSDAVTGLIDFDYFLTQDVMLYAKYSRGYRQGSVNIFGPPGLKAYEPEEVDAYEIGAKSTFGGPVPGTFNIAVFYNDLTSQQIQLGAQSASNAFTPTTAIVNAGASVIQGVEIDTSLMLLDDLMLNLAYTFLDTEVKELDFPTLDADVLATPAAVQGSDLSFSPHNALTATLTYMLPLPESVGDVSAGVTYTYTDSQFSTAPERVENGVLIGSPYAELSSYELFNLNLNWQRIAGSNFDAALFMTNVLDEEYTVYVPGVYRNIGAEFHVVGLPRMWGARLRYSFGQ